MTAPTEKAHGEAGGTRPPAPRRGTRAYRRALLEAACQREYDEFNGELQWLWAANGWAVSVDLICEMLGGLAREAAPGMRDAYGHIRISEFMISFPEDIKLRLAAKAAREEEGLSPHEALRVALENGEQVYADYEAWKPVCQEALNAIEAAGGGLHAARPVLLRHVPPADRRVRFLSGVVMVHSALRVWAFPKGTGWIEPWLDGDVPQLPVSHALYGSGEMDDAVPPWMLAQRKAEGAVAAEPRRRKRRQRYGPDPDCTCGLH